MQNIYQQFFTTHCLPAKIKAGKMYSFFDGRFVDTNRIVKDLAKAAFAYNEEACIIEGTFLKCFKEFKTNFELTNAHDADFDLGKSYHVAVTKSMLLNLRTGEWEENDGKKTVFNRAEFEYKGGEIPKPKMFIELLTSLFGEEYDLALHAMCYSMLSINGDSKFIVAPSDGGRGKGTFTELITKLFPQVSEVSGVAIEEKGDMYLKSAELIDGLNYPLWVIDEVSEKTSQCANFSKKITGGTKLQLRKVGKPAFEVKTQHGLLYLGNNYPNFSDIVIEREFDRRLVVFEKQTDPKTKANIKFNRMEETLAGKIYKEEGVAIYNYIAKLIQRLIQEGRYGVFESTSSLLKVVNKDYSIVEEYFVFDKNSYILSTEFNQVLKDRGIFNRKDKDRIIAMMNKGGCFERFVKINNKSVRIYSGVKFREFNLRTNEDVSTPTDVVAAIRPEFTTYFNNTRDNIAKLIKFDNSLVKGQKSKYDTSAISPQIVYKKGGRRALANFESLTGLISIDIDHVEADLDVLYEKLKASKRFSVLGRSFSGSGIFGFVQAREKMTKLDDYYNCWENVASWVKETYGIDVDKQTKDPTRLRTLGCSIEFFDTVIPFSTKRLMQLEELQVVASQTTYSGDGNENNKNSIIETVQNATSGERNGVLHWAYNRFIEKGYNVRELIAPAMVCGLKMREINATLRLSRNNN